MKKEPDPKESPGQPPAPIVQPIVDELTRHAYPPPPPPPKPAELDQDPGGGFNPDHTDIQT